MWNLDHSRTEEQVRSYLAQFSFFDDDVFKKTRDLSGGEKGRLALAKIIYTGGNVMLLDEPTNHLDVYTREALEEALERFTGALIVVSHDRYFIDRVVEHVILVDDGTRRCIRRQLQRLRGAIEGRVAAPRRMEAVPVAVFPYDRREHRRYMSMTNSLVSNRKSATNACSKIDAEIADLESRIASAERERERNDLLLCSEEVFRDGERSRKIQSQNADLAGDDRPAVRHGGAKQGGGVKSAGGVA